MTNRTRALQSHARPGAAAPRRYFAPNWDRATETSESANGESTKSTSPGRASFQSMRAASESLRRWADAENSAKGFFRAGLDC